MRWLWDGKNKIQQDNRKPLVNDFRSIVFSTTGNFDCLAVFSCKALLYCLSEPVAYEAFNKAIANSRKLENANYSLTHYVDRLQKLWDRRSDWVIAYRDHHSRGNFTNNYAEITVRLFKENVLNRRKSYNAASLVDIICSDMENYYRNRLLEFAHCRNNLAFLRLDSMLQKTAYLDSKDSIRVVADGVYSVPSESGDQLYEVNSTLGYCTCKAGMFGKFANTQQL